MVSPLGNRPIALKETPLHLNILMISNVAMLSMSHEKMPFAREISAPRIKNRNVEMQLSAARTNTRRTVPVETIKIAIGLESVVAQLIVHQKNEVVYEEKIVVLEFEVKDKVPPPLTGKYMPPLANLSFTGLDDSVYRPTANKTSASTSKGEASVTQTSNISVEMPKVDYVRTSGVIIEDWVSNDDDIFQSIDPQTTVKPSFKKIKFTKARNESVKTDKQADKPKMVTQNPKVDRRD
ncbi:hypothetical protein Tco_0609216 [Tanacetum coccineum]